MSEDQDSTRQEQVQLKPCPFCGEAKVGFRMNDYSQVRCWGCGAEGGQSKKMGAGSKKEAIAAWNLRAEHPADDGEPVTEEWLREMGAVTNGTGQNTLTIFVPSHLAKEKIEAGYFTSSVSTTNFGVNHHVNCLSISRHKPTRGMFRRLCAALGIPLKT